jgi:hypothetical protein
MRAVRYKPSRGMSAAASCKSMVPLEAQATASVELRALVRLLRGVKCARLERWHIRVHVRPSKISLLGADSCQPAEIRQRLQFCPALPVCQKQL